VIPQIVNALLSRHNFILLGLRGQPRAGFCAPAAISGPEIPVMAGCEINDNPLQPFAAVAANGSPPKAQHADRVAAARPALRRKTGHTGRDYRRHHR